MSTELKDEIQNAIELEIQKSSEFSMKSEKLRLALDLVNEKPIKTIIDEYGYSKSSVYEWKKKLNEGNFSWVDGHLGAQKITDEMLDEIKNWLKSDSEHESSLPVLWTGKSLKRAISMNFNIEVTERTCQEILRKYNYKKKNVKITVKQVDDYIADGYVEYLHLHYIEIWPDTRKRILKKKHIGYLFLITELDNEFQFVQPITAKKAVTFIEEYLLKQEIKKKYILICEDNKYFRKLNDEIDIKQRLPKFYIHYLTKDEIEKNELFNISNPYVLQLSVDQKMNRIRNRRKQFLKKNKQEIDEDIEVDMKNIVMSKLKQFEKLMDEF